MKKYILSEEQLENLLFYRLVLEALETGGVDNWSGYSESLKEFLQDEGVNTYTELAGITLENYIECPCTESALLP